MQNYRDLVVWQRAMDLVELTYGLTRQFPKEELFALTSQMRRAAISVPSNIAEGQGRGSNADFVRFLRIAYGSLRELETQYLIAQRLRYLDEPHLTTVFGDASEVGKLLNGLMRAKRPG